MTGYGSPGDDGDRGRRAPVGGTVNRPGDRIFRGLATASGALIVASIVAIGAFLLWQAIPALRLNQANFFTSAVWQTGDVADLAFGIRDLVSVTVMVSVVALVIAMPVSLGIALFLTQYAPRHLARPFSYIIDLLAAVPSIIFGLWGIQVLAPALSPVARWLNDNLAFIPFFATGNVGFAGGGNIFTAGVVLAVMLLPIITNVTREVFQRTPTAQVEGALALGATRWEVIRTTVLPFGKAGYVSASMLGLGRALGETIAVMVILSTSADTFGWSIFDGGDTIASKIARSAAEFSDPRTTGAFIAAGLVLFLLTFGVNAAARSIVAGKKEYE
ncbi:phosphate transport system permease protein [Amycolatopsis arida]|uniref:Phosphate transport system permease protein n=1 Tax=Amycolatopsis arida TaxID=587909 RepID=A0A1I5SUF8_9PSEU|nr:phosphate ABC transporter permease subunit PstC [Amycolatopsis arida]TDX96343.1 phosphate transport system permease protein [Amycolatopsis arida]SFP74395.1 phosphate transport system permease protein [Amycolatopsis arida]